MNLKISHYMLGTIVALLALAGQPGCESGPIADDPAEAVEVPGACAADSECPGTEICLSSICSIDPPDGTIDYGLIVIPPRSSKVARQVISVQSLPVRDAEIIVDATDRVIGEIQLTNGEPAPDGTVIAQPENGGLHHEVQAPLRDGQFELHVPPGDFRFLLVIDDSRWPRLYFDAQSFPLDSQELALEIPQLNELRTITGEISRELLGGPLDLLSEPVEGAIVTALGTGAQFRATEAVTDEDGQFLLRLPPGEERFDILIAPGPENPFIPYVSFSEAIEETTNDVSLSLGEWLLELVPLSLELLTDTTSGEEPHWPDYRVNIRRSLGLGELLLTPEVDDEGRIETDILSGSYDIEIITPPGDPWSSATTQAGLLDGLTGIEVELEPRHQLSITVVNAHEQPVVDTRTTIAKTPDLSFVEQASRSDRVGQLSIWVDPGDYRISLFPSSPSGLPRHHQEVLIPGESEDSALNIQLEAPMVVTGQLSTDGAEVVEGATIEAYQIDERGEPIIISKGRSRGDGSFRLVFPASVVD